MKICGQRGTPWDPPKHYSFQGEMFSIPCLLLFFGGSSGGGGSGGGYVGGMVGGWLGRW